MIAFAGGEPGFWASPLAPHVGARRSSSGTVGSEERFAVRAAHRRTASTGGLRPPAGSFPPGHLYGTSLGVSRSPTRCQRSFTTLRIGRWGVPALFVPFRRGAFRPLLARHDRLRPALRRLGVSIKGLTVVSPHKEMALKTGPRASAMVRRAGSANIVVRDGRGVAFRTPRIPEGRCRGIARARDRHQAPEDGRHRVWWCRPRKPSLAALDLPLALTSRWSTGASTAASRAQRRLQLPFTPARRVLGARLFDGRQCYARRPGWRIAAVRPRAECARAARSLTWRTVVKRHR